MTKPADKHLAEARACLIGASERLAMMRRIGQINSNDRDLLANATDDLCYALDLVWDAQIAAAA